MNLKKFIPERREHNRDVSRMDEWDVPFSSFQKEVNRMFDDFFAGSTMPATRGDGTGFFMPKVNVAATERDVTVSAELPGVEEKDIEVSVNRGILTISGDRKEEKEENARNYYVEQSTGSFHREIQLPDSVDPENVKASFKKGVLKIMVPLLPDAQKERKKIPIKIE